MQSFFRLVIMVGTAVVGGMALKVYGPPPEKLGPLFERAMQTVKTVSGELMDYAAAAASATDEATNDATDSANQPPPAPFAMAEAAPRSAVAVWSPEASAPEAAALPLARPVTSSPSRSASINAAVSLDPSLEKLVAGLEQAGASGLELAAWGADGQLVRCSCTAPVHSSVFRRLVDTIEPTPREALQGLLLRVQSGGAIAQAY